MRLIDEVKVNNSLAECILWNSREQSLWWTDIQARKLHRYFLHNKFLNIWDTPERLCSFGFTENPEVLIAAFESGFAYYNPFLGQLEWLAKPEANYKGMRFNDGRVDRQGRFWAGTLVESADATNDRGEAAAASLYRLDKKNCELMLSGVEVSNSLCWSPDSCSMYFCDSATQKILCHSFDSASGNMGSPQLFASIEGGGFPDGSTVDAEGCLWNAEWRGARVLRYKPTGEIDLVLPIPTLQPTCVCFAGPKFNLLCVSSARDELPEDQVVSDNRAGNIFIYETDYTGLDESLFRFE